MSSNDTLFTRADLDDFPDDGKRRELVDGELLVSPLARAAHQRVVGRITHRILGWIEGPGHGTVYPGVNVDLAEDSHLEPDVAWTAREDDPGVGFEHAPELVVEVLSPGTAGFDRGIKRQRYLASGAVEVWLVDLDAGTIEVVGVDGGVQDPVVHHRGDTFTTPLLPGLTLDVTDLLGPGDS